MNEQNHPVILVDGTCAFCTRLVSTILRRDKAGYFHFAYIQGEFARAALSRQGRDPDDIDPIYLILNAGETGERVLMDGAAGREIWPRLFKLAIVMRWIPLVLLNLGYRLFARVRYPLFGQLKQCYVPTPEECARFHADVERATDSESMPTSST